jgi:hypothetical protein
VVPTLLWRSFSSIRRATNALSQCQVAADKSVFVPDQSHHDNVEDRQHYEAEAVRVREAVELLEDEERPIPMTPLSRMASRPCPPFGVTKFEFDPKLEKTSDEVHAKDQARYYNRKPGIRRRPDMLFMAPEVAVDVNIALDLDRKRKFYACAPASQFHKSRALHAASS